MSISRLILGGLMSVFGLWFIIFIGFMDGQGIDFMGIFIGLIFLALGIVFFLNKNEDKIESRKDIVPRKTKNLNKRKNKK